MTTEIILMQVSVVITEMMTIKKEKQVPMASVQRRETVERPDSIQEPGTCTNLVNRVEQEAMMMVKGMEQIRTVK